MTLRGPIRLVMLLALTLLPPRTADAAASRFLILVGSGGEEKYEKLFAERATRLRAALVFKAQVPEADVAVLSAASADAPLTLETLGPAIASLASRTGAEDLACIILIGHGSQIRNEPKFQIPGPDLDAKAFGELLGQVKARTLAVINTTASSSGFVNFLSAPGRVVFTATKSAGERNATRFTDHLVAALEEGSADQNRDDRISLLEWLQQADALTQSHYTGEGLISSEHALLDDNGDALGTRISEIAKSPAPAAPDTPPDGPLAASVFIRDFEFPPAAPRQLVEKYLGLLEKIESLKAAKSSKPAADYERDLEKLLLEAARAHREIRSFMKNPS